MPRFEARDTHPLPSPVVHLHAQQITLAILPIRTTQHHGCDWMSIKAKRKRKVVKMPRDIIGAKNVRALKYAGFVVVR